VDRRGVVASDGEVTPEISKGLRDGTLGLRQKPGPNNALGLIKFDMPNRYDIYLHGTPAMELFEQPRRDFSHGCIRVEDPVALAEWVLREKRDWSREHIQAAMSGRETPVRLETPIAVLVVYGTAAVTEEGTVQFFDDIYRQDSELERRLAERNAHSSRARGAVRQ
jgi:murein L,D-transpeptidase YcbB/YkuD